LVRVQDTAEPVHRFALRSFVLLVCLVPGGIVLTACGAASTNADPDATAAHRLLSRTLASAASAVKDGRMRLAFRLDPEGLLALGGPIKLNIGGTFAAPAAGDLPRFDVQFATTLATHRFTGGVSSTGAQAFVRLGGRPYRIDDGYVKGLRRGLATEPRAGLRALGIDPLHWISEPRESGHEQIDGVDTVDIRGRVQTAALLEDLDSLLTKAGGPVGGGGLLTPQLRRQIAGAVDSSTVDLWTGATDNVVRRIHVVISFAFKHGGLTPIPGLNGGKIDVRLDLRDVNATRVDVGAPPDAQPLATLTGGGIGDFIGGIGGALTDGDANGLAGQFLSCVTGTGDDSAQLVRCISKLHE
jgi:hypothetical protein